MKNDGKASRLAFGLGQYPGHLNFDPKSGRVAVDFTGGNGFDIGATSYSAFTSSAVNKGALNIPDAKGNMVPFATAPLTQASPDPVAAQPLNPTSTGARMPDKPQDANNVVLQTSNGIELKATRASDTANWQLYQSRSDGLMAPMGELPKSLTADQLRNIAQEGVFNSKATVAKNWNMSNESSFTPASIPLDFANNATTFTNKKGLPVVATPLQNGKDGVLVQGADGSIVSVLRSPANTPPLTRDVLQQYINKEGLLDGIPNITQAGQRSLPPTYESRNQALQPVQSLPPSAGLNPLDGTSPQQGAPYGAVGNRPAAMTNVTANAAAGDTNTTDQTIRTPGGNTVKIALSDDRSQFIVQTMENYFVHSVSARGNTLEGVSLAIQQGQYDIDGKIQRKEFNLPVWGGAPTDGMRPPGTELGRQQPDGQLRPLLEPGSAGNGVPQPPPLNPSPPSGETQQPRLSSPALW
jgi:hypothetical protein